MQGTSQRWRAKREQNRKPALPLPKPKAPSYAEDPHACGKAMSATNWWLKPDI